MSSEYRAPPRGFEEHGNIVNLGKKKQKKTWGTREHKILWEAGTREQSNIFEGNMRTRTPFWEGLTQAPFTRAILS